MPVQETLVGSPGAVRRGYAFLDAARQHTRLAQSYSDQAGLGSTAFLYDNALVVLAYLADGRAHAVARAAALGDAMLYAQTHDPEHDDGRLRHAYLADGFVRGDGTVAIEPRFASSAVGDLAWAGIALAALARHTGQPRYATGAVRVGTWIDTHTRSESPLGGYAGGFDGAGNPLLYTSTEHNIGCVALFGQLSRLTGDRAWRRRRDHAASFLTWMWCAAGGFFHTGTDDGTCVNECPTPEDAQSWSYLALGASRYQSAVDWALTELAVPDGVTFSSMSLTANERAPIGPGQPPPRRDGIWYEGNAHLAAALRQRRRPGDEAQASLLLAACERAQEHAQERAQEQGNPETIGGRPVPNGAGVISASMPLDTGYGYGYYPYRHIGATAWYLLATARVNPLAA